jgi:hypothetical protein
VCDHEALLIHISSRSLNDNDYRLQPMKIFWMSVPRHDSCDYVTMVLFGSKSHHIEKVWCDFHEVDPLFSTSHSVQSSWKR